MKNNFFRMIRDLLTPKSSIVIILVFILVAILATVAIHYSWDRVERQNSEEAIKTAKIAASALSGEMVKKLNALPGDTGTIAYKSIKQRLVKIKSIVNNARFAYLFAKKEGKIYFMADSEPEDSKDYSPPGQEYSEVDTNYVKLFDSGKDFITPPIIDRWGNWVSVHVPIIDEKTGRTIAVFGMDYEADRWKCSIVFDVLRASAIIVIAFLLSIFLLLKLVLKNKILNTEAAERKQVEEALRESEAQYRLLFETSADGILIANVETKTFKFANPALCRMLGYTEQEMKTMGLIDIHPKNDLQWIITEFESLARGEKTLVSNIPCLRKDGSIVYADINSATITIDGSICNVGYFRDVTERKQAAEALSKSELRFKQISENAQESIWEVDSNGLYTYVSPIIKDLLGYEAEEIVGIKHFYDFFEPEKKEEIKNAALGVFARKESFRNFINCNIHKDGRRIMLSTSGIPMLDKENNLVGYRGVDIDITECKRAEEELKSSEEQYRTLFENVPIGIGVSDLKGKLITFNDAMLKPGGYSRDEIACIESVENLYYDLAERERVLSLIKVKGFVHQFPIKFKRKDGSPYDTLLTLSIIHFKNQPMIQALVEDITERKQTEMIIEKTNTELINLNAEKDKFFSIIAHDLRSPFQGFLSMTEIMADSREEISQADLVEYSKKLNQAAHNLYKLLENLLAWAQVKNGSIDFTPKNFDLSMIVFQNIDTLNQRAQQKGITIINEIERGQKVYADEKMVGSVLRNLLSNAVKFTKKDGIITLKANAVSNDMIEIAVEDAGIGISERLVNKLFKIDEKVGRKGTEGESSTGLGLLLCKEFVEKHDGKIWVESEEGKGSTFTFSLPKKEN